MAHDGRRIRLRKVGLVEASSFPRKRESIFPSVASRAKRIPACAGMTTIRRSRRAGRLRALTRLRLHPSGRSRLVRPGGPSLLLRGSPLHHPRTTHAPPRSRVPPPRSNTAAPRGNTAPPRTSTAPHRAQSCPFEDRGSSSEDRASSSRRATFLFGGPELRLRGASLLPGGASLRLGGAALLPGGTMRRSGRRSTAHAAPDRRQKESRIAAASKTSPVAPCATRLSARSIASAW
jgi:hypothetical protein